MSFLTPLYLLGALAIGLPILAHLIRRTPPRRQEFSSVLFLTPSVPKVTRRSRIEHWPLLLHAGVVIALLALAFARPLWRTPVMPTKPGSHAGRPSCSTPAPACDARDSGTTPASNWCALLSEYGPTDHVGVFTFDSAPRLVWSWDAWTRRRSGTTTRPRSPQLSQRLAPLARHEPRRRADTAAETPGETSRVANPDVSPLEIVVISDMQSGSRLDALLGYAWPEEIPVRLVRIGDEASPDNAGLQSAAQTDGTPRLRVINSDGAASEAFSISVDAQRDAQTDIPATSESRGRDPSKSRWKLLFPRPEPDCPRSAAFIRDGCGRACSAWRCASVRQRLLHHRPASGRVTVSRIWAATIRMIRPDSVSTSNRCSLTRSVATSR